jgi:CheY-like chemotaxis protein
MLSHELRNPLAPIVAATHVVTRASPQDEPTRRAVAVIQRQTKHLARLVDDLLDVTRITRGKIQLDRQRVDLTELVRQTGEDFRSMMESRGIEFVVRIPDDNIWVDGDATRIAQVVGNLLHNAAKFTGQGDRVTLALEVAHDQPAAVIRVRDTGVGIPPELMGRMFEPFVHEERSLARSQGGLGLALVKGITELHGGTARVESGGPERGAEFIVRLPLAEAAATQTEPARSVRTLTSGHRVLIVEDNRDVAQTLAELVETFGYDTEAAYDGPSALAKIRANPPDIVLCDIGLPGISGYELAAMLRADRARGMRLIAVSGYSQPEDLKRCAEAGFDAHLAKPPDPAELERLLSSVALRA